MSETINTPISPQASSSVGEPVKQSPQERLKEITAGIEQGIQNLFASDKYAAYLRTMSHFHRYSVNNTMLIYMQKPDATLVAGFNKWKDQFDRHVNRGEKGIKIIAPVPYTVKQTREKRDPQTKSVLLDDHGQALTEEVEVKLSAFRVVPVFDVSQTNGKPLPTIVNDLQGNVDHFDAFMEAVLRSSPVPIETASIENGADGFFSPSEQQITIRNDMSEVQTVSAAIHEITHAMLHNDSQKQQEAADVMGLQPKDRRTEEMEAESVSYAVCQYYGIETADNSFGYIAEWSKGKDLPELRSSLETINRTASELITKIDRNLKEIIQERGLTQEQKDNYLKNAEMATEDDYGMIDGIINNGKSPAMEQDALKPKSMPSMREQLQQARQQTQNQPHVAAQIIKKEKER